MDYNQNILMLVIRNLEGLFEGNLRYYAKLLFHAPNANNPYHNFRHMFHVTCMAYRAGVSMKYYELFGARAFRALLIACMFHDYAHSGVMGDDATQVNRSVSEMRRLLLPEDADLADEIEFLMRSTQFPHIPGYKETLGVQIVRDCDLSQALTPVWVQQIVFGLAAEMNKTPLEILKMQVGFLGGIVFKTEWAKETFNEMIPVRIKETEEMYEMFA